MVHEPTLIAGAFDLDRYGRAVGYVYKRIRGLIDRDDNKLARRTSHMAIAHSGCHTIQTEGTCTSHVDGRNLAEAGGFRIRGEPCVWCCGTPCTGGATPLCEPWDWVVHQQAFTGRWKNATVDACKKDVPDARDLRQRAVSGYAAERLSPLPRGAEHRRDEWPHLFPLVASMFTALCFLGALIRCPRLFGRALSKGQPAHSSSRSGV